MKQYMDCDINFSDIPWILYGPVHQSKILVWNEVLCHETFSLWQHSLFIPLGSPNSLEPSPAAVTLGKWSAWVSNLANDLPAVSSQHLIIFSVRYRTAGLQVTKFYPWWVPRLAKCLGACQIVVQYEALCGQFLHNGDLLAPPQIFSLPRELHLQRIWEKIHEVFKLPEVEMGK